MKNVVRVVKHFAGLLFMLIIFPLEILLAAIVAVFKKGRAWLTKRIDDSEYYLNIGLIYGEPTKLFVLSSKLVELLYKIERWIIEINQALDEDVY